MLLAAAIDIVAATHLEQIPARFWLYAAAAVAIVVAVVLVLPRLAQTNKVLLSVIAVVVVSIIGFNWIYERNEPSWATPAVSFLADFLPTKGKVRQQW